MLTLGETSYRSAAKAIALLLVGVLFWGCHASDSRLIGRWKSNRDLSITTFPHRERLSPEKRAIFDGVFGRLTVTYTRHHVEIDMAAMAQEQPIRERARYRVIGSTANSVTVRFRDVPFEGDSTKTIHFVGPDRYWILVGESGGREYFDRVIQ